MRYLKTTPERLAAFSLLIIAWVLFDYRFLFHPLISMYGFPRGDYGSALWDFWVTRQNLAAPHSLFFTTALFGGHSASLFYHTLNLLYFFAAAPFYLPTGNVFLAFNVSQLLADALSLLCFYRLARAVGTGRGLAVLGAACFTFCAYRLQHWPVLNLQSTWLISLYAWMLLRVWKRQRLRDGIILGLAIAGLLLSDWHCLIFAALATPFLLAWFGSRFERSAGFAGAMTASAIALPVLAFYAVLAAKHAPLSDYAPYTDMIRTYWSASPLHYVTPGWLEWIWLDRVGVPEPGNVFSYKAQREWALFVGLIPLFLFLFYILQISSLLSRFSKAENKTRIEEAASKRPGQFRRDLPLLAGMLFFFIISLGPYLIFLNPVTVGQGERMVQLPALWLFHLPIFSALKHVSRFGIMVLFLMLLFCMAQRSKWTLIRNSPAKIYVLLLLLIILHRADMAYFVPRTTPYQPPKALEKALAPDGTEGFAAVVPSLNPMEEGSGLYLQTLHQRPELYGYLSRQPRGALDRALTHPFYQATEVARKRLLNIEVSLPEISYNQRPALVLLLPSSLKPDEIRALENALTKNYGYQKTYSDGDVCVFHLKKH